MTSIHTAAPYLSHVPYNASKVENGDVYRYVCTNNAEWQMQMLKQDLLPFVYLKLFVNATLNVRIVADIRLRSYAESGRIR